MSEIYLYICLDIFHVIFYLIVLHLGSKQLDFLKCCESEHLDEKNASRSAAGSHFNTLKYVN